MLILSRRRDEVLIVLVDGQEVARISVVDIRADKVRLGLTAETRIGFVRAELGEEGSREQAGREAVGNRHQALGTQNRKQERRAV